MTQSDPGVYLEDIEYYAAAAIRFMSGYVKHAPELLAAVREALPSRALPSSNSRSPASASRNAQLVARQI